MNRSPSATCRPGIRLTAVILTATVPVGCTALLDAFQEFAPWSQHTIDNVLNGADGVRLADVNNDNLPDIATAWEESARIRVYLNPSPANAHRRWPHVTVGSVGSPEDAVFADLNNDGAVDVVSCSEGSAKTVWIHWAPTDSSRYENDLAWRTDAIPATVGRAQWMFALPMDIDGQHSLDLVVGAKGNNATISWLQAPADPRNMDSWAIHDLYHAGWIMTLAAEDLDNDGDLDIVASDRKGDTRGCLWLENPGPDAATSPWPIHRIGPVGQDPVMFLDIADLDADGLNDIVVAISAHRLHVHRRIAGQTVAWDTHTIDLPDHVGTAKAVAVGDIDLDTRQDIVVTCENAADKTGVFWLAYPRDPTDTRWTIRTISSPAGAKFDLVQLLDLDADGDLDVLTCEERQALGVIWYENPTIP